MSRVIQRSSEPQSHRPKEADEDRQTDDAAGAGAPVAVGESAASATHIQALMAAGGNTGMLQLEATGAQPQDQVQQAAQHGVRGSGGQLPHMDAIQRSFGSHDVGGVEAHVGGQAKKASDAMGAAAYATGDKVAFASAPTLHTAAHEAAHVVQQRGGVSLKGGVGQVGDRYEQHADAVADRVVQGKSAEGLLDQQAGGSPKSGVQSKALAIQRKPEPKTSGPAPAPKPDAAAPVTKPKTSGPALAPKPDAAAPVKKSEPAAASTRAKAQQLYTVMQAAWTDCSTATRAWISQVDAMGLAYFNAYTRHETVRNQQKKADELRAAVMFGVLQLVTAGALSSLATIAKDASFFKNMAVWKVDGILDVAKGALGTAVGAVTKPNVKSPKVGQHPNAFHGNLKNAVNKHATESLRFLNGLVQGAKNMVVGTADSAHLAGIDINAVDAAIQNWKKGKEIFRTPGSFDAPGMTKELEIGLWAQWVQKLSYQQTYQSMHGTSRTSTQYISPGGVVEKHVSQLTGQDFDFGWYTSDAEVKKIMAWGRAWAPSTKYSI